MASKLTLGSFVRVDQDQISFPIVTNFCALMRNIFTMMSWSRDPLVLSNKVLGHLRYFTPCRIKVCLENKQSKCHIVRPYAPPTKNENVRTCNVEQECFLRFRGRVLHCPVFLVKPH